MGTLAEIVGRRLAKARIRPRSVVLGRQRWDAPLILGRPAAAKLLELRLQSVPGIVAVHASAVTGRILVRHEASLNSDEVGRVIRQTVSTAIQQAAARKRQVAQTRT